MTTCHSIPFFSKSRMSIKTRPCRSDHSQGFDILDISRIFVCEISILVPSYNKDLSLHTHHCNYRKVQIVVSMSQRLPIDIRYFGYFENTSVGKIHISTTLQWWYITPYTFSSSYKYPSRLVHVATITCGDLMFRIFWGYLCGKDPY